MSTPYAPPRTPLEEGLAAARANLLPGLLLQAFALAIVLGYYFHPPTHAFLQRVEGWKHEMGLLYPLVSTAFFAGLIPYFLQYLQRSNREKATLWQVPFLLAFWGLKGIEVEYFYRFQAWMFGDEASIGVIVTKVAFDQGLYVPLWAVPSTIFAYAWKDEGFRLKPAWARLADQGIGRRLLPILLSNWSVWIPAVAIIYCLPQPLQLPLQNVVLCMWVLILMFLTSREQPAD